MPFPGRCCHLLARCQAQSCLGCGPGPLTVQPSRAAASVSPAPSPPAPEPRGQGPVCARQARHTEGLGTCPLSNGISDGRCGQPARPRRGPPRCASLPLGWARLGVGTLAWLLVYPAPRRTLTWASSRSRRCSTRPSEAMPMATTRALEDVLASEWSRTACPTYRARPTRSALVRIQAPAGTGVTVPGGRGSCVAPPSGGASVGPPHSVCPGQCRRVDRAPPASGTQSPGRFSQHSSSPFAQSSVLGELRSPASCPGFSADPGPDPKPSGLILTPTTEAVGGGRRGSG